MTIAELLAAIADAPDDAMIYIEDSNGDIRSQITVSTWPALENGEPWEVIVTLDDEP